MTHDIVQYHNPAHVRVLEGLLLFFSPLSPSRASIFHYTVRMRSDLLFFALYAAARSLPALSFLVPSCSRRSLKVSISHERLRTANRETKSQQTSGIDVANLVDTLMFKVPRAPLQHNSRWCTCLPALDEGMNGEKGTAVPSEGSSTSSSETNNAALVEAAGAVTEPGGEDNGVGGVAVDLAKGITFETPKPKDVATGEDDEEGSEAKKLRVILYTILSLVPFLLLLPFLGSRDFVPLDPNQL